MNIWIACVLAENAKLKRTLARGLVIAVPMFSLLMSLLMLVNLDTVASAKSIPLWQAYMEALLRIWASFPLPLMATLQAVLIAQLEHANRQCKYLLAMPVPRASLYVAKSVNLFGLMLQAHLVLWLLALAVCAGFGLAPGTMIQASGFMAHQLSATLLAASVLTAIQLLVAIHLQSLVGSICVGLVATLVALFGAGTLGTAAGYFPWSMPQHALQPVSAAWLIGALLTAVLITALGARSMRQMQVQ